MTKRQGPERWIEAGLAEIAAGGIAAVRVEVLAKKLGVTKGGFYWHFKDQPALLNAILRHWADGRIAAIEKQTADDGAAAAARLKSIIQLYSDRVSAQGMAIELAIRQWSRGDEGAAAAVAKVDAARLKNVQRLYERMGYARADAEGRAFLFYAFVFGQSLLAGKSGRSRLIEAASSAVIGEA